MSSVHTEEAGLLGSVGDKAAGSKEIDEGWKEGGYGFFNLILIDCDILTPGAVVEVPVFSDVVPQLSFS
jgi:hypothetical protein